MTGRQEHQRKEGAPGDGRKTPEKSQRLLRLDYESMSLQREAISNFHSGFQHHLDSYQAPSFGPQRLSNTPSTFQSPYASHDTWHPWSTFSMQQQPSQGLQRPPMTPPPTAKKMGGLHSSMHIKNVSRESRGSDTYGSSAETGFPTTNMMNVSSQQSNRYSDDAHLTSSFNNSRIAAFDLSPTPSSQVMTAHNPLFSQSRLSSDRELANFENNLYGNSDQSQLDLSGSVSSSSNGTWAPFQNMTKLRGVQGGLSQRNSNIPVQHPSTPRPMHNTAQQKKVENKVDIIEPVARLVLESEPRTRRISRTSKPGPIQPPRHTAELKSAPDAATNKSLSKRSFGSSTTRSDTTEHLNTQLGRGSSEISRYEERVDSLTRSLVAIIPENVLQVATAVQAEIDQLAHRNEPGFLQQFRPSNSALKKVGLLEDNGPKVSPDLYGSSTHYMGDITIANNRSANIPDYENCAVWVLGLPANTTHTELLGSIRGVGQIYASVINPPTGQHHTAAAKIVFFERKQAENFLTLVFNGHFQVMGRQIRNARWNKIKSPRYPLTASSRVIRLTGPAHLMDFGFFEVFFKTRFTYELECAQKVPCLIPGKVSHEWNFGSLRCQSASAKTSVERELNEIFSVEWARDPCM